MASYQYMERAKTRLMLVVPLTLLLIFVLLYLNFQSVARSLIVLLSVPFSLIGAMWILAVLAGASQRVRPIMMTASAILFGLLPILWSHGAGMDSEIKKLQRKYDWMSNIYDFLDWTLEYSRYRECRKEVWKYTQGTILDAGIGTGRNIDFYPPDTDVTGIDLSAGMLRKAEKRARQKSMSIRLHHMDVLKMSFPDHHFDVIVATFLCCVIPDSLQVTALREMRRVCKRDGEIILLEYAFSKNPLRRLWMNILTPYVHWVYGARFDRRTSDYVRKEHFHVLEERFLVHDVVKLIRMKP